MDKKIGDWLLDLAKYAATVCLLYPMLTKFEQDWRYFTGVGAGVLLFTLAGLFLHRDKTNKKKKNKKKDNKSK
jgi:hypothetical protein